MPEMTDDEIRGAIGKKRISGIALDTTVFDKYGCNLHSPVLESLSQFKGSSISLIISEIVKSELIAHIEAKAASTQQSLRAALKQHRRRWMLKVDVADNEKLLIDADPREYAEQSVNTFIQFAGATIVPAAGEISIAQEVLRRYFSTELPFEAKEAKKHEFPDAFALLSLSAKAKAGNGLTLCVSSDNAWLSFCQTSENLVCVRDITEALGLFERVGLKVAEEVMRLWRENKALSLVQEVERAFEYALDGIDFFPYADMPTSYDIDQTSAVLQYVDPETASSPIVIDSDDETITFTIGIDAVVSFEADFHSYVEDSVDGDNVSLGSVTETVEQTNIFELTLTITRKLDPEPEIVDISVTPPKLKIDFGYVDPFPNEDPTFEKY